MSVRRIAYLECATGISGDMTLAALVDAGVPAQKLCEAIESLGLPQVSLRFSTGTKRGFAATFAHVDAPVEHVHRRLSDIRRIIAAGTLTARARGWAESIFLTVATAEAKVHGIDLEEVHFHEVGALDSIVDIVGVAVGFDALDVTQVVSSPVPTGYGRVRIAHGVCPVPAPATAEILKGVPLAAIPIEAELTTPTGAAIVKTLASRFSQLPAMTVEQIGYGAGTYELADRANLLRLFVGTETCGADSDTVLVLETNLDDVSAEVIGYTCERLLAAGALDVFATAVTMKKSRPGTLLTVLVPPTLAGVCEAIVFGETRTFGVRRYLADRTIRARRAHEVQTPWGTVAGKLGWLGSETPIFVPEFAACRARAEAAGVPLMDVYRAAESAFALIPGDAVTGGHQSDHRGGPRGGHDHDHSHDHGHDHRDSHSHDHDHNHSHDHGHDHDHGYDHSHDHDRESPLPDQDEGPRS